MDSLRVTLIQTNQFWEDKQANLNHFEAHLNALKEQTDLVLLPEMFHTGFSMNAVSLAEDFQDSQAVRWLQEKAIRLQTAIYTSFICKDQGCYYNRGVFVFPDGKLITYDKRKLFSLAKEEDYYTAGKQEQIVNYKGFKLFLSICFDLRFPEIQRNEMISPVEAKYDVILNVANWPQRRALHWKSLCVARAIENQCFFVGVNRVGVDNNNLEYSGDSAVYSPLGQELTAIQANQEQLETITIHKSMLYDVREKLNFLKDI